jgi:hypothetical protein
MKIKYLKHKKKKRRAIRIILVLYIPEKSNKKTWTKKDDEFDVKNKT